MSDYVWEMFALLATLSQKRVNLMGEVNAFFFWVTGDCKTETNAENYCQIKFQDLAIKIASIPLA